MGNLALSAAVFCLFARWPPLSSAPDLRVHSLPVQSRRRDEWLPRLWAYGHSDPHHPTRLGGSSLPSGDEEEGVQSWNYSGTVQFLPFVNLDPSFLIWSVVLCITVCIVSCRSFYFWRRHGEQACKLPLSHGSWHQGLPASILLVPHVHAAQHQLQTRSSLLAGTHAPQLLQ